MGGNRKILLKNCPRRTTWSQIPISRTGLLNTRGEETSPRLPRPRGSAETPDEGKRGNEDGARRAQNDIGGSSNYTCGPYLRGPNVIHNTKYGSEMIQGMKTKVSTVRDPARKLFNQHVETHVEALADSGASASIISMVQQRK